uniref:Uncharacterized protein n=1 Tax=Anguilla anguilla TaxID=7936 RepID=A0A0E9PN68_ANGAN
MKIHFCSTTSLRFKAGSISVVG